MFLRFFEKILEASVRIASRNPRWTLAVWTGVLLLALAGSARVKILLEIDELIDPSFKSFQPLKELRENFGLKNNVTAFVRPQDHWTKKDLCALRGIYNEITANDDNIERAYSPFLVRASELRNGDYRFPNVIDIDCRDRADLSKPVSWSDHTYWEGTTFLTAKSELAFDWFLHDKTDPITKRRFDTALVKNLMQQFDSRVHQEIPDASISWFGSGTYQYHMMNGYITVGLLNFLMTALLALFFRYFFGTWKSTLIFGLLNLQSTLVVTGIMGFFGLPVDVLSISLFMILMIANNEDFIFLSTLMQRGVPRKEAFRRQLVPGFFTSLTTIVGFGSLMVSDLPIISRFGMLTAIGALVEWVCVFLILPQIMNCVPLLGNWVRERANKPTRARCLWTPRRPLALLLLLLIPLGMNGALHLAHEDSPYRLFRSGHVLREQSEKMRIERGWNASASVLFPSSVTEQEEARILREIAALPLVQRIDSIPGWKENMVRPFPEVGKTVYAPLLNFSPGFERYIGENRDQLAYLYLKDDQLTHLTDFTKNAEKICGENCQITGSMIAYSEFGDRVARTLAESLAISFALVALIIIMLSWGRQSAFETFALIATSFWGPCAILAFLAFFKIEIYFVGTIFASILTGLAGDNQIQFIFFGKTDRDFWRTAATRVCLLLVLFPLVFLLAPFAPLQFLGAVFAIGSVLLAFGDISLLSGLLPGKNSLS